MKKCISLILSLVMALSLAVPAFADYSTTVTYTAIGTSNYIVTVPATLAAGGAADEVKVEGTWTSKQTVNVTTGETIDLICDLDSSKETVAVTFDDIAAVGSDTQNFNGENAVTESISVAAPQNALFGKWSGTIVYNVSLTDNTPQQQTFSIKKTADTANNVYTWADLAAGINDGSIAANVNVTVAEAVDGTISVALGDSDSWYSGVFNANGNTDNCSFNDGYVFDYVDGATIKNLKLNGTSLAGLIKNAKGTVTISDCTFTDCTFQGESSPNSYIECLVANLADGASVVLQNVVISGSNVSGADGTYNGTWNGTTFTPAS